MAKQQLRQYTFTPGTANNGIIKVPGKYDLNQFLLITNTTRNTIIYNFADSSFSGALVSFSRNNETSFPNALDNTDGVTYFYLPKDTSSYSSTDTIQIFIDQKETIVRPWDMGTDAFERMRVATPMSMLDADFEYGLQPTKWQVLDLVRGYASFYEVPGTDILVTSVTTDASTSNIGGTGSSLITVTTTNPHGLVAGGIITIKGLLNSILGFARAEGSFIINTVLNSNTLTYYAKAKVGTLNNQVVSSNYTQLRKGNTYFNAPISTNTFSASNSSPAIITATFSSNHGLVPGMGITVVITSDDASLGGTNNHSLAGGPFYVQSVVNLTTITYTARASGVITGTPQGYIFARPDCFYVHRPLDGGVQLGTGGPGYGSTAIRQSKKYIRYQSGKAINYNTGALFAASQDIRSINSTGTTIGSTITITTDDTDHGCQVGATIQVSGVITSGYNGQYTVTSIIDERNLTVTANQVLGSTTGVIDSPCNFTPIKWHGSIVRAGTFDDQNGVFWQYDGNTFSVVKRSATFQLAGFISVNSNSNLMTGQNTRFTQQLAAGDKIVLRGMTHTVTSIIDDFNMTVNPDFRGAINQTGVKAAKILEKQVIQSNWNVDRCDGTNSVYNPSGYLLDVSKMQMIGIQWTWYGAGFIDFMLRGPEGKYITVHRMKNSNVNREAYMRSGNQPVRYEVANETYHTYLTTAAGSTDTTLICNDTSLFPSSGTVYVDNELISFTGNSNNTLTGCTRSASLTQFVAGSTQSFTAGAASSHGIRAGVLLVSQTVTPIISHWGSAFLTDGGFDSDRGYIFNYQATNISISTKKTTAFAIRLAPSVSDAIIGDLGTRDLINRAQLLLQSLEITAGGSTNVNSALVIEGILNPQNYPGNYNVSNITNITWNSLNSTAIPTGQPSFTQIANGSSITFDNGNSLTTSTPGASISATVIPVLSTTGIAVGDDIFSPTVTNAFAGNTKIVSFIPNTSVTISAPLITALSASAQILITRSTYALPGETVFSFIAGQSTRDGLDLSALKELTNTPIGGSGTFPNGPDTLFINVYLTQGSPILSNLIIRWGEAQA